MIYHKNRLYGRAWFQASTIGLMAFLAACSGSDGVGPTTESPTAAAPVPTDSTVAPDSAIPVDSTLVPVPSGDTMGAAGIALSGSAAPGIVFGSYDLDISLLGPLHTGALRVPSPNMLLIELSTARARGARLVVKLVGGSDSWVKNGDGTFSLTKWQSMVARFKAIDFGSYIADGTVLAHILIDEPNRASKWGGKIISQATLEAMAKYSKQLWPTVPTVVRVVPSWLAASPVTYTYLDAGWTQYTSRKGDAAKWLASEVASARSKGLGVVVSMNVLDGGNGSSGIRGYTSGLSAMSATELRTYGNALLNNTYGCGFFLWTYQYGKTYYARADIKSAMTDLSNKAKAHAKTSCRQ
ncbi:MAG TPA: hypothetical protein VGN76_12245 [Gemmatimonadales bacterium]|nr:hypothetical protein [Gemmatimonadales bacterium]